MIKAGSNTIGNAIIDSSEIRKAYYRGYLVYYKAPEQYIVFADSEVEQICATNWGDGVGIKPSQASQVTRTQFGTTFRNNSTITSFNELSYFTGLTGAFSAYAFENDSALESITIPSWVTSLPDYCFSGCTSLSEITFLGTSINTRSTYIFNYCGNLTRINIPNADFWVRSLTSDSCFGYYSHETHLYINGVELTIITVPNDLTAIEKNTFQWCVGLEEIILPSTITSIGNYAFEGCSGLINLSIPCGVSMVNISKCGNGTGILHISGNATGGRYDRGDINFKHVIIEGNVTFGGSSSLLINIQVIESVRVYGNLTGNSFSMFNGSSPTCKFVEVNGVISSYLFYMNSCPQSFILHLGYDGKGMNKPSMVSNSSSYVATVMGRITKIYVGPGESQAGDQAVLDAYLADADWATYSSKLDLWYNYNGDYKVAPTITS